MSDNPTNPAVTTAEPVLPRTFADKALAALMDPRKRLTARQRREFRALLTTDVTPSSARANQFYRRTPKYAAEHFIVRLEKRSLRFLLRQQAKVARLLAARDRLLAELGGSDSMAARLVSRDGAIWEQQLAAIKQLVKQRTAGPASRDARPKRVQRLQKAG